MSLRRRAVCAALGGLLSCQGCFDVEQVKLGEDPPTGTELIWPTLRTIDDFDDGDLYPTWKALGSWTTYAWPEPQTISTAVTEPGSNGTGSARVLEFELTDPLDEERSYPGAQLVAQYAVKPLDLSRYDKLVFDARLELVEGDEPAAYVNVRAKVGCGGIGKVEPPGEEEVSILYAVKPSTSWQTFDPVFDPVLEGFLQPEWQKEGAADGWETIDPSECLSHAERLYFEVWPDLMDGQSIEGSLSLDNIFLEGIETDAFTTSDSILFSAWTCAAFADTTPLPECEANTGQGVRAPAMTFYSDTHKEHSGVSLCATPASGKLDLLSFDSLSFEARFEPDAASPGDASFWVELSCSGLPDEGFQHPPLLRGQFEPGPDWSSFEQPLSKLERLGVEVGFENRACLSEVDELCFTIEVPPDVAQAGTLSVDKMMLR